MFKLVIQDDEGKTTVVPLIRDEITIGRKEGNTIRLTERNVSRRHARIMRNNGEVHIEDLGSYNGIRVNNARIAEKVSLRVSDQVQIGDYKLYLKAEGVEQADEARTMPLERIDGHGEAVGSSQTPTMPLGVPAQGTVPPPVSALVGDPNRTQVAIADTDPAGRPIASAASVAAVPASAAYGKLVVLSSNFAGKELELARPQMIIGRTDENDLVINHRSISRNHAKVVRDRDTGRYTISDLQSSNGVRVNGQDYSQVELRRADVVDLGHVRLRFVEPGEDFVFSAAAITDVPDVGGSKRGLLVAVVLGIVVLGAVGVYMLTRNKEEPVQQGGPGPGTGSGSDQIAGPGSGTGASNDPGPGSAAVAVATVPPDAAPAVVVPVEVGSDTCAKVQGERKWIDLKECAATITDKAKSKELAELAASELKAEMITNDIGNLAKKGKLKEASAQLKKIPDTSVYRREAQDTYDNAAGEAEDELNKKYAAAVADRNCQQAKALIKEANVNGVSTTGASATCTPAQVATNPKNTNPTNGSNDNLPAVKNPPPVEVRPEATVCDAAASKKKGEDYLAGGMDMAALAQFEGSLRCKPDAGVVKLAYMASCRAKSTAKAKLYFNKIPAAQQGQLLQICVRAGVDPQ